MKSNLHKISVLFFSFIICSSVVAADSSEDETLLRVTPRLWLSFANTISSEDSSTEMFFLPMFGATLAVTPRGAPYYNFLLTGLYGEGDGDFAALSGSRGDSEAERVDVEFLVRYNYPGKNFSVFVGPRFVNFYQEDAAGALFAETDTSVWVLELGIGTVTNITDDGRHRFFGNFTLGAAFVDYDYDDSTGWTESGSGTYPAIDFNFGYQYSIGLSSSFSIRYRGFLIFDENDFDQTKLDTFHGPELALTINF
ncbi:MAG: hypothetical protein PVI06_15755 [Desulfobacterales bacterium]